MCELDLFIDMMRGGLCKVQGAKEIILVVEATTYASHVHQHSGASDGKFAFLHTRMFHSKCDLRGYGSNHSVSDEDRSAYLFCFEREEFRSLHMKISADEEAAPEGE